MSNSFPVLTVTIPTSILLAAQLFAADAKQDERNYLRGICLDWKDKVLNVIGTNGEALAAFTTLDSGSCGIPYEMPDFEVILAMDALTTIDKKRERTHIELNFDTHSSHINGYTQGIVRNKYPNWRRVMIKDGYEPTACDDIFYSMLLMTKIQKSLKIFKAAHPDYVHIKPNGSDVARFYIEPIPDGWEFKGCLSPVRFK